MLKRAVLVAAPLALNGNETAPGGPWGPCSPCGPCGPTAPTVTYADPASGTLFVTFTRYVADARVDGTSTTIAVFVNEYTVRGVPPTVTVGATPEGLKFEPASEM